MATTAHHTAGRRVVVPGFLLAALTVIALLAFLVPALGSGSSDDTTGSSVASAPSYPREVRVADLRDATLRETALRSNPPITAVVEVGPGVYAERRPGPLGSVGDYTSVFGRCADVNRFAQTHVVARTCY